MKIKKLQSGGGFLTYTPFTSDFSTPVKKSAPVTKKAEDTSGVGILDKTTFEYLIKNGGLVNDIDDFVSKLQKIQTSSMNPFTKSSNVSASLQLISEVNKLRNAKYDWQTALRHAEAQGSLGDVAVGPLGEVYVKDEDNKLRTTDINNYLKNAKKWRILTNNDLLVERQYNPELVGNSSIINTVGSSIGIQKIINGVQNIIDAFGNNYNSTTRTYEKESLTKQLKDQLSRMPNQQEAAALSFLSDIENTPGQYVNVQNVTETERSMIDKALNYIWGTLGDRAQKQLNVTAKLNGYKEPKQLLLDMIINQTTEKTTSSIEGLQEKGTSGSGSGTTKEKPITPFELLHLGKLGKESFQWNDPSTKLTFDLVATGVGKLTDLKGNSFGMVPLKNFVNSDLGAILDTGNIYFGSKKIAPIDLNNIIGDGTSLAARVYMPVDENGAPDYNKLYRIKQLEQTVLNDPNLKPEQINKIFEQNGLSMVKVDENREYKQNDRYKPFLVFTGYTGEKSPAAKANPKLHQLTSDEENTTSAMLKNIWREYEIEAPVGINDLFTNYYKGLIAIPYVDNAYYYIKSAAGNLLDAQPTVTYAREKQAYDNATELSPKSSLIIE